MVVFPDEWHGLWTDEDDRGLYIIKDKSNNIYVTILFNVFKTINANKLRIDEHLKKCTSRWILDEKRDTHRLQIEVGLEFIGPTYNLYPIKKLTETTTEFASENDLIDTIVFHPEVHMGLYDDWEDDLGVPWAFPYKEYSKASLETETIFKKLAKEEGIF